MANDPSSEQPSFLTSGPEQLKKFPGFQMVGREDDLRKLHNALMRKDERNNVVLIGQSSGVGTSSLLLSIQAAKDDVDDVTTPLEILDKKLFYLDVNSLFSLTSKDAITAAFKNVMETLRMTPDAVLVIEDTNSLLKGIVNNQATSIFSELMESAGTKGEFQTVFLTTNPDFPALLGFHADIAKICNMQPLKEPSDKDLRGILEKQAEVIGEKYGITIPGEVLDTLMKVTAKYPGITRAVGFAQPKCSIDILEGAAVEYCRAAQGRPEGLLPLQQTLTNVASAEAGEVTKTEVDDMSPEELAELRQDTQDSIDALTTKWMTRQKEIRKLRRSIEYTPAKLQGLKDMIEREKEKETGIRIKLSECDAVKDDQNAVNKILKEIKSAYGIDIVYPPSKESPFADFNKVAAEGGWNGSNRRINDARDIINAASTQLAADRKSFAELTKKDDGSKLVMGGDQVLSQFSDLSGIEVTKLRQNEKGKLKNLEEILGKRIFGQPEPLMGLADAVRRSRTGMKDKTAAIGNFLFLGPTGTGKTETALALAEALFDDDRALQKYNMGDYAEENSITGLIGAPQGYQGHVEGGQLVNNMIERPSCVNLFDEIEKANAKILNTFLAITDTKNANLIDSRTGDKVPFANAVNIFTSNVGQQYFLDPKLSPAEARERALAELRQVDNGKFKAEFLGRLDIFCYDRLSKEAVYSIAQKSFRDVSELALDQGIKTTMPAEEVKQMSQDVYDPLTGGRGIVRFINNKIASQISNVLLDHEGEPGSVEISYIPGKVTDEDKAGIRKTIMKEEYGQIRGDVQAELFKQFQTETENGFDPDNQEEALKYVIDRRDALTEEKIDKRVAEKTKALAKERALISADFVPADGKAPATVVPANSNTALKPAVGM